jgi:hypothetical protein
MKKRGTLCEINDDNLEIGRRRHLHAIWRDEPNKAGAMNFAVIGSISLKEHVIYLGPDEENNWEHCEVLVLTRHGLGWIDNRKLRPIRLNDERTKPSS